eukprot:6188382-Pleurochrysis_carterae.AAC.1
MNPRLPSTLRLDAPFLAELATPRGDEYFGFKWHGPRMSFFADEPLFGGSLPFRDIKGDVKGYLSVFVGLNSSFTDALRQILDDNAYFADAEARAILYTESGVVLASTEYFVDARNFHDMPTCRLHDALHATRQKLGELCMEGAHLSFEGGELYHQVIDVQEFDSTTFGLPPLPERWCVLTARQHGYLYRKVHDAEYSLETFGIIAATGLIGATVLISITLFCVLRSEMHMKSKTQVARAARRAPRGGVWKGRGLPFLLWCRWWWDIDVPAGEGVAR